ncbi:MAG TPA: glycoside hydrolase family 28 protein, partial [Vicinamibacteria bacterium]|nr:glycoside hydrolase family 28 protein [Vicinamibacteria bacterium]
IDIDMLYEEGENGPFLPVVRNVGVQRMTVARARYALRVRGMARSPVRGLRVADSRFQQVHRPSLLQAVEDLVMRNVSMEADAP